MREKEDGREGSGKKRRRRMAKKKAEIERERGQ